MIFAKICGLTDPLALNVAIEYGAKFIGIVFYPDSPRAVTPTQAKGLIKLLPQNVEAVGLFVNPTDKELDDVLAQVSLHMIQLHGDESPQRVVEIKETFSLPVMKAFRVSCEEDFEQVEKYEPVVDWLLFDSKNQTTPPPAGERAIEYGGTGQSFDWTILKNKTFSKPWMLAGGLTILNIGNALSILSPDAVDVSSGVEKEKGVKDPEKIKEFLDFINNL
jgi:phosphoribosylanthranilate isomerase